MRPKNFHFIQVVRNSVQNLVQPSYHNCYCHNSFAYKMSQGFCGISSFHILRGSDCKYRESVDRLKKSKILITCQKNTFGELSSKMLFKLSGTLLFSRNSEKAVLLH